MKQKQTKVQAALAESQEWIAAAREEVKEREAELLRAQEGLRMHLTIYEILEKTFSHSTTPTKKSSKPVNKKSSTTRRGGCAACDYYKPDAIHLDSKLVGYHVYQPSKSKRASGLGDAIKKNIQRRQLDGGVSKMRSAPDTICVFPPKLEDDRSEPCYEVESNPIHDPTMGYAGYHEFVPASTEQAEAASGD